MNCKIDNSQFLSYNIKNRKIIGVNMKFYTSYFYKLRFFTPNMLPFSTAKWDPKWYHNF